MEKFKDWVWSSCLVCCYLNADPQKWTKMDGRMVWKQSLDSGSSISTAMFKVDEPTTLLLGPAATTANLERSDFSSILKPAMHDLVWSHPDRQRPLWLSGWRGDGEVIVLCPSAGEWPCSSTHYCKLTSEGPWEEALFSNDALVTHLKITLHIDRGAKTGKRAKDNNWCWRGARGPTLEILR